ncbi:hypothetical protein ACFWSF_36995 [Streptomyces sp. NPDC058611]|uniref:hypothetical protein n=1 Tax=unclassified Streptomyces TaxID=2593676 RepID=UPI0036579D3E
MLVKPFPPPQIPAIELRPSRRWYATAGAIAVVLIVMGVAIGAFRFNNAIDAVDTNHQFANGDIVTLRLEPGSEKTMWIRDEEFGPSAAPKCSITGPGDPGLTDPGVDVFLTGDETWNPLYTIDVPRAGDYQVTCSSHASSKYAIGDSGGFFALAGWLVLAIALPILGITICAVIVLITTFRRSRRREQLLAERQGSGGGNPAHASPGPGAGPQ